MSRNRQAQSVRPEFKHFISTIEIPHGYFARTIIPTSPVHRAAAVLPDSIFTRGTLANQSSRFLDPICGKSPHQDGHLQSVASTMIASPSMR